MQYYRCKCGKRESWGSMGPFPCERCSTCGSNLAGSPSAHVEPSPNRMLAARVTAQTDAGSRDVGTLTSCIWCGKTLAEVEKLGHPWEHFPLPHQVFYLDGKRHHWPTEEPHAMGYMVRAKLEPDRCGYALFIDPEGQPLGSAISDTDPVPWGSRVVAVPSAHF